MTSPHLTSQRQIPPGQPGVAERAANTNAEPPQIPPRPTFLGSFVYAGRGLWQALYTQRNMRVHVVAALLAIVLGIVLRISPDEFAIVFLAIGFVLVAEMINTVAEAVVDLATQQYHPLARMAKDVAAGAVLLSAIVATIVALFVYLPYLLRILGR